MQINLNADDIRPLIEQCLAAMLAEFGSDDLLYDEREAAALLKVPPHVLKRERLSGNVTGCRVGKRMRYSRRSLVEFIERREGRD